MKGRDAELAADAHPAAHALPTGDAMGPAFVQPYRSTESVSCGYATRGSDRDTQRRHAVCKN
jgi:hypothetical protein